MESKQFNFRYTSPTEEERKEIESIRKQYCASDPSESKFERLKRLDKTCKRTPTILGLTVGILGCLIFGFGLALCLEFELFLWGVIVAAFGAVTMAVNYPLYLAILKKNRETYGAEILQLSEELLNESKNMREP